MFNFETWAKEFFEQPVMPMNEQISAMFFNMTVMENQKRKLNIPEIQNQFLYQLIEKRAEYIGLELSDQAKVFLMFETKSPGTAVMYLYALRSKFTSVTMNDLANVFPDGFPTEDTLEKMWDKQKGYTYGEKVDNYLDGLQFVNTKKNKM